MQAGVCLNDVLRALEIEEEDCLCLYQTGSRVYGTSTIDSDWDFVMILKDRTKGKYVPETRDYLERGLFSTTLYEKEVFEKLLCTHNHLAVCCLCSPPQYIWRALLHFELKLIPAWLYASFSRFPPPLICVLSAKQSWILLFEGQGLPKERKLR
jgi:hypothetical protein